MKTWLTYQNIWTRNIIFCTLLFSFAYTQNAFAPNIVGFTQPTGLELLVQFLAMYLMFFMHNHFAVRLLLFKKKYGYFILSAILFILFATFVQNHTGINQNIEMPFIVELQSGLFMLFIGTGMYFLNYWILTNVVKTKIELIQKENELNFLKQQLSPHFLFNAINNLYGTALAEPHIITDKILELSDLLRYQVESTTRNEVCITEEMDFVQNYLNYTHYKTNNLSVSNEVEGEIQAFSLPPLLFLPLLENAIKYSAETEEAIIKILWRFEDKYLQFTIQNNYLSEGSMINGTKVGIDNLKKRLQLLDIKHHFKIDTATKNIYKIDLKIWRLSTNV